MRTSYRFSQYAKAGMVFAATTVTYFFARATGVLPSWLNWDKTENTDLIVSDEINNPVITTHEWPLTESALFRQHHLLQQSSVSVVNPIPDQLIDASQSYSYSLNNVFSGNFSLIGAKQTAEAALPSWLSLQYDTISSLNLNNQGLIGKLAVENNILYMGNGDNGMQIVDISDPFNPMPLASCCSPTGDAFGVAIQNNMAFLTDSYGIQVIDVSNPQSPYLISLYNNPVPSSQFLGIAVQGNLVFAASEGTGLQIIDISNSNNPSLIGYYNQASTFARDVKVRGDIVFVAFTFYGLQILNVSNPASPEPIGYAASGDYLDRMVLQDNKVFIEAGRNFIIFDISNLSDPQVLGSYTANFATSGIAVQGDIVLLVNSQGVLMIDASDPTNPHLVGQYDTISGNAVDVIMLDNLAYLGKTSSSGYAYLDIINLRNAQITGAGLQSYLGQYSITVDAISASNTLISDQFMLTIDQPPYLLNSILTDQSIFPNTTRTLTLNRELLFNSPEGIFLTLSAALSNSTALSWLNFSINPGYLADYILPYENIYGIVFQGDNILLASSSAFQVINGSNLVNLFKLGMGPQTGGVKGIAVNGNIAYVSDWVYGLQLFNINNPTNPILISSYALQSADNIRVQNNTAFVTDSRFLKIFAVNNPANPLLIKVMGQGSGLSISVVNVALQNSRVVLVGSGVEIIVLVI